MLLSKLVSKSLFVMFGFAVGTQLAGNSLFPTDREIIEILSDYDVRHIDPIPGVPYYGVTDHENHIIYIVRNQDYIYTKRTVIHELAHVVARHRMVEVDEDTVNSAERVEYRRLFIE